TALGASACTVTTASIPLAPPGVQVRPAVARGYAAFETRLAPWGTWAPDYEHGVHWCPSQEAVGGPGAEFQPYLSRGHWESADAPIGRAPAGSPVWRSEDRDTWGEITTHHGWWIRVPGRRESPWCWVPGMEETPAQVAWREGDGFVGWAPDAPDWVVVDDVDYEDWYDWAFTLLGTLLDRNPDQNSLSGEARDQARRSTSQGHPREGSARRQKVGPSGNSVHAARAVLDSYVIKHPDAIAAAASRVSAGSGGGHSGSKSKSSSAKAVEAKEKEGVSLTAGATMAPPMPPAMA